MFGRIGDAGLDADVWAPPFRRVEEPRGRGVLGRAARFAGEVALPAFSSFVAYHFPYFGMAGRVVVAIVTNETGRRAATVVLAEVPGGSPYRDLARDFLGGVRDSTIPPIVFPGRLPRAQGHPPPSGPAPANSTQAQTVTPSVPESVPSFEGGLSFNTGGGVAPAPGDDIEIPT